MALGIAWNAARSGLSVASGQMSLVSQNVARVRDPDATRKAASQQSLSGGGVRLGDVGRSANLSLLESYLSSHARAEMNLVIEQSIGGLGETIGDPEQERSPAARLSKLEQELRLFAAIPSDTAAGRSVLASAVGLAGALNEARQLTMEVRDDADREIANAVTEFNRLLGSLEEANTEILRKSGSGEDLTSLLDSRDGVLKQIAGQIGIRVLPRNGNDIQVYTESGIVLFETVARKVEFEPRAPLGAAGVGAEVMIDGVPSTGVNAVMALSSGRIAGLVKIRDDLAVTYGGQLDEIARGLISTFADVDRSGGGGPNLPGLFTWQAASVPTAASVVAGLAAQITVNAAIDPAQGGSLRYLRDGGASAPSNPNYNANPSGASGYSGRISELVTAISSTRAFAATTELDAQASLMNYSAGSAGWIGEARRSASAEYELRASVRDRAGELLSGATGIDLDRELADMLVLERSYQASSRLLATVDGMLQTLFSALR